MVDPVEVKLDEIEDHVLKTQADVDRLMRDFSKPEKGKELLAQLPGGGGGGFLDQIIKGLSGKGGIMSAGMAGGLAAGGILALVQIIGDAISNSKILMTVLGTIGKALGLLIDVILLPFLPILTTGIIWLFQGIMLFYRLWNGIWTSKVVQGIAAGIVALNTAIGKGIGGLLTLGINFLGAASGAFWSVLTWIYDLITKGAPAALLFVFGIVANAAWALFMWLFDVAMLGAGAAITFIIGVGGAAVGFLTWLYNTITSGGANLVINLTQGAGGAAAAVGGAISNPAGWLEGVMSGGWLPHFGQGGTVPGTGPQLVVAHGGEKITPPGAGGHTFNFYGYDDNRLQRSVENILRRQNNRYNA